MNHKLVVHRFGGPEVLEIVPFEPPPPGEGQALVRIRHAGVNFADVQMRSGAYPVLPTLPYTPGFEFAGVVAEVGAGVDEELIGAEMVGLGEGAYASHIVAAADGLVRLPPSVDGSDALSAFTTGLTAYLALTEAAGACDDEVVLVHAAAGGVGAMAVQIAKLLKLTVVAAAGSTEKLRYASELGADHVVDYTSADWVESVRSAVGTVDIALDMAGGEISGNTAALLSPVKGRSILFGNASGQTFDIDVDGLIFNNTAVRGFSMPAYMATEALPKALGTLLGWLEEGSLRPTVRHRFPLADAAEAHRLMERRGTTGKVVLDI